MIKIKRREMIKTIGGISLGSSFPIISLASTSKKSRGSTNSINKSETDVLIIGGGTAGSIAGIQAARTGARTMLIETGGQLGGTTTTGGVSYPGLFHAWGRQVIAGIGWEMVLSAVYLDNGILPDFSTKPKIHSLHQVRVNGPLYAAILEEAFVEAGGQLSYYELPRNVRQVNNGYELDLVGKETERTVFCKQLIDCTGDANIVGMLGFERLREESVQPATMMYQIGNYDVSKLDSALIEQHYKEALQTKKLLPGDTANPDGENHAPFIEFLRGHGSNRQHLKGMDGSTSAGKTIANIEGRRSVLRILRFVKSLPGCENVRLMKMQTETGIRETYRILGETVITKEDYTSGRVFDDAVCYSYYPIDLHEGHGVQIQQLTEGTVPTIPFGALVPKGSRNLLVAGRAASSDRLSNSALRVQATCMAMGQAAGAASALAAQKGITPLQVPLIELHQMLISNGAIVPTI